ncbi:hypothetical protein POAN111098_01045 [Polynucleobacter antarcticus]|uniref:Uncharacterized protein n=2 Tax=Polynucleobacter antarcticus TaxID=1743162 RepID=A0A6M9PUY6_9BURK|nr:hypothetical protein DCO16_05585 [Polynucleobacter antarcticus]
MEQQTYKQKYIKPKLTGGGDAPYGLVWRVYAVSKHHLALIGALSQHRKQYPSEILSSALSFYSAHYKDEVDVAFDEYAQRFDMTGKMLHPYESQSAEVTQ